MNALQGQPVIYVGDRTVYLRTQLVYLVPDNPSFWPHWEAVGTYYDTVAKEQVTVKVTFWSVNGETEFSLDLMSSIKIRRREK